MYTKEQASAIRQKFWTNFGKYMQPVPSASDEKVNWINYKTGIKGISFKMEVDNSRAFVAVEIALADVEMQNKYFDLFKNLKREFQKNISIDWTYEKESINQFDKKLSLIYVELIQINIYRNTDWPTIISFLKQHIIALDFFWSQYKVAFEMI